MSEGVVTTRTTPDHVGCEGSGHEGKLTIGSAVAVRALPVSCDVGCKHGALQNGRRASWRGRVKGKADSWRRRDRSLSEIMGHDHPTATSRVGITLGVNGIGFDGQEPSAGARTGFKLAQRSAGDGMGDCRYVEGLVRVNRVGVQVPLRHRKKAGWRGRPRRVHLGPCPDPGESGNRYRDLSSPTPTSSSIRPA
jgi:hypothetical protein